MHSRHLALAAVGVVAALALIWRGAPASAPADSQLTPSDHVLIYHVKPGPDETGQDEILRVTLAGAAECVTVGVRKTTSLTGEERAALERLREASGPIDIDMPTWRFVFHGRGGKPQTGAVQQFAGQVLERVRNEGADRWIQAHWNDGKRPHMQRVTAADSKAYRELWRQPAHDELWGWMTILARSRALQLQKLEAYVKAAEYPLNGYRPQQLPVFVDRWGIACAVGYLMLCSGRAEDVRAIAAGDNHVRVMDASEGPLIDWVLRSGLTQEECAQIQPTYRSMQRIKNKMAAERERVMRHLTRVQEGLRKDEGRSLTTALRRLLPAVSDQLAHRSSGFVFKRAGLTERLMVTNRRSMPVSIRHHLIRGALRDWAGQAEGLKRMAATSSPWTTLEPGQSLPLRVQRANTWHAFIECRAQDGADPFAAIETVVTPIR